MANTQTDQSAGAEIQVVHSSSDLAKLDEFDQIILGLVEAPEVVEDPDEISRQIVLKLLSAESDEQLTISQAIGWGTMLDLPIEIQGFRWRRSEFEEGAPIYVLVSGTRIDTGEYLPAFTCGSYNVLAQLSNLARRGQLPGAVWQLTKSTKPTGGGFYPLWLTKTPDEVVEAARVTTLANPLLEPDES